MRDGPRTTERTMRTTASDYLNQTVLYGGLPVRRYDVERHLESMGATGPARMLWANADSVEMEPAQAWNGEEWVWL